MRRRMRRGWLYGFLLLTGASVMAEPPVMEFSAQAIQQVPNQPPRLARMHVTREGVRMEYEQNGQLMVEIFNLAQRRAWLLMPEQRLYMEHIMPDNIPSNFMSGMRDANPCSGLSQVQCQRLGEETVDGRPVMKWEMNGQQDGRMQRSLHWIDQQRNMPLRQLWPDGTVSEMHLIGQETRDGRLTEKWQWQSTGPNGKTQWSTQWYDPQLQITVREELPGGYLRELRDIRVAAQPDTLFQLPAGYQRVVPPVNAQQAQPAGSGHADRQAPVYPQPYR